MAGLCRRDELRNGALLTQAEGALGDRYPIQSRVVPAGGRHPGGLAMTRRFALGLLLATVTGACGSHASSAPTPSARGTRWLATWAASSQEVVRPPADSIADRR